MLQENSGSVAAGYLSLVSSSDTSLDFARWRSLWTLMRAILLE